MTTPHPPEQGRQTNEDCVSPDPHKVLNNHCKSLIKLNYSKSLESCFPVWLTVNRKKIPVGYPRCWGYSSPDVVSKSPQCCLKMGVCCLTFQSALSIKSLTYKNWDNWDNWDNTVCIYIEKTRKNNLRKFRKILPAFTTVTLFVQAHRHDLDNQLPALTPKHPQQWAWIAFWRNIRCRGEHSPENVIQAYRWL